MKDMRDWNLLKNNEFRSISGKFSLPDAFREVFEMMQMKADIKWLTLSLNSRAKVPTEVIGDKSRLQQILINLV